MNSIFSTLLSRGFKKQVPATGLGLFRIFFGLVILQELIFLGYFRHLIFDDVPYVETAGPLLTIFLALWICSVVSLIIGLWTRTSAIVNYLFWIGFVAFTPMWRDFDGGFDQLMTCSSLILIFVKSESRFSIDNLLLKLHEPSPNSQHRSLPTVPVIFYYLFTGISLGLVYFDACLHKFHSVFWLNGLGSWLPNTIPYYISSVNAEFLLNNEILQKTVGYSLIIFQFLFIFLVFFRPFRIPLLIFGCFFHVGIIVFLNIYPFGFGMLIHYLLLVPFKWWRTTLNQIKCGKPWFYYYYNSQYLQEKSKAMVIEHFDLLGLIGFRGFSDRAQLPLTVSNRNGDETVFSTGFLVKANPVCGSQLYKLTRLCFEPLLHSTILLLSKLAHLFIGIRYLMANCGPCKPTALKPNILFTVDENLIGKLIGLFLFAQINSTVYYAALDRFGLETRMNSVASAFTDASIALTTASHIFIGVTPHALYMDDHFNGYKQLSALTYVARNGAEIWVPFIAKDGRFLFPYWGRIHSMWANVAMHPAAPRANFERLTKRLTAYWAEKLVIGTIDSKFRILIKPVDVSYVWVNGLRQKNLHTNWTSYAEVQWLNGVFSIHYTH